MYDCEDNNSKPGALFSFLVGGEIWWHPEEELHIFNKEGYRYCRVCAVTPQDWEKLKKKSGCSLHFCIEVWKLECTWSASHASVLHSHLRHLKPFIHAIIEGRTQTRVHDLSLAVNKNENCFPQEALCYLDSGSGESVQFPRVYVVRGDAVKETCQHDQPHCSTLIRFGWWKADVAARSGTDVWKQAWELAGSEERRLRRRDDATDVTSGPLATSNTAFREAWRGRSLVTCHGRRQDHG